MKYSVLRGLLFLFIITAGCTAAEWIQQTGDPAQSGVEVHTTIFLARHSEKATGQDPPLTREGEKRAGNIARILSNVDITVIYSTPFQRTRGTADPLADLLDIEVREYDPNFDNSEFLSNILKDHRGEKIMIIGHSNTIPNMLNILTNDTKYQTMDDNEYEHLYAVVVSPTGEAEVIDLTTSSSL